MTLLLLAALTLAAVVVGHLWSSAPLTVVAGLGVWTWAAIHWGHGPGAIVAGAGAALITYLFSTFKSPRTDCWWCGGNAKRRDGTGRNHHFCLVCGGRGWRLRWGARARSRHRD